MQKMTRTCTYSPWSAISSLVACSAPEKGYNNKRRGENHEKLYVYELTSQSPNLNVTISNTFCLVLQYNTYLFL